MESSQTILRLLRRLSALLFIVSIAPGLCSREKTKEEQQKEKEVSREMFAAFNCKQNQPAAVSAFSGCWKICRVQDAPSDEHLTLGMRMTPSSAQLLIKAGTFGEQANSKNPRFCSYDGLFTVAPNLDEPFITSPSKETVGSYTYVYMMQDLPKDQIKEIADQYYESDQSNVSREEYRRIFLEFVRKGGKYIQTFIVQAKDEVWWESTGEEDLWALPTDCKGWKSVEEQLPEK